MRLYEFRKQGFFDWVPVRNLEIWNSMIAGYVQNGFGEKALLAFEGMGAEGFEPDEFTVVSVEWLVLLGLHTCNSTAV